MVLTLMASLDDRLIHALLYNGLTVEQIQALLPTAIDREQGWLNLEQGAIPLVTQTAAALDRFQSAAQSASSSWIDPSHVPVALQQMGITEAQAHRQLAGALWITSDDTQIITSVTGFTESPILPLRFMFPFSVVERLDPTSTHEITHASRAALQAATDWLERAIFTPKPSIRQRVSGILLEGKTVFMLASTGVNGLNLLYNLVMARLLSPAAYSQLALMVTLQLLIGLLPSAWQTAAARFGAAYHAHDDHAAIHHLKRFGRRWMIRIGAGVVVISLITMPLLAQIFQVGDAGLLLPIIIAIPFFLVAAADRGVLQGIGAFYALTAAYVGESLARFAIGVLLVLLLAGTSGALDGAVWGVGQSMIITWFIGWLALHHMRPTHGDQAAPHTDQAAWMRLTTLTLTALIGQVLITNSDFLLVKSLFPPADSGLYAAVSVLGRIAYFGALPLTIIMVPMFARRQALNQPTRPFFLIMLAGGALFCAVLLALATLFPAQILNIMYGEAYVSAAGLLPLYTLAASLYVIVNLVITYRVALGKGGDGIFSLIIGVAQVIGILLFHATLEQVIVVQIVLMSALVIIVVGRGLRADAPPVTT